MKKYAVIYLDGGHRGSREVIDFFTADDNEAAVKELDKRYEDYLYAECHCKDRCYCGAEYLRDCDCEVENECTCEICLREVDIDVIYWDWQEDAFYTQEELQKKEKQKKLKRCKWIVKRELQIEEEILKLKKEYAELGKESDRLKKELDKE